MGVARIFRSGPECRTCLKRLVDRTAESSVQDDGLRRSLKLCGKERVEKIFREGETLPVTVANDILRMMKEETGCQDPYLEEKRREMEESRKVAEALMRTTERKDFPRLLELSALANSLDYFKSIDDLLEDSRRPFRWAISDGHLFEERVKEGRGPFLYLADNAGELYFDLPLFQAIAEYIPESYYVVKGGPAQNDLCMSDLAASGMARHFGRVITHGQDVVGLDIDQLNGEFRELYDSAALLLVKGMGHYESLSGREQRDRTFFVLKAKCDPTARSLGVAVGAFVAFMK